MYPCVLEQFQMTTCRDFTSIFYIRSLNLVCPLTNMFTQRAKYVQSIVMDLFLTMFRLVEIQQSSKLLMNFLFHEWKMKKTKWKTKNALDYFTFSMFSSGVLQMVGIESKHKLVQKNWVLGNESTCIV